ncbi:hypothetical protein CHUAL_011396 [Chamberlinius hualienensis]
MNEAKLCELVGQHKCLYDVKHKLYKDVCARENAWKIIAENLNQTTDQCKKRWRNIRDTYFRRKKKAKKSKGLERNVHVEWHLESKLSFLNTIENIKPISKYTYCPPDNLAEDDEDVEDEQVPRNSANSDISLTPQLPRPTRFTLTTKRPKLDMFLTSASSQAQKSQDHYFNAPTNTNNDAINSFFLSIAASVKRLPTEMQLQAKLEILKYVNDLELLHYNLRNHVSVASNVLNGSRANGSASQV